MELATRAARQDSTSPITVLQSNLGIWQPRPFAKRRVLQSLAQDGEREDYDSFCLEPEERRSSRRHLGPLCSVLSASCWSIKHALCLAVSVVLQAYTSQFVALIMFALLMCDDRISMQPRRCEIIQGLRVLPGRPDPTRIYQDIALCC